MDEEAERSFTRRKLRLPICADVRGIVSSQRPRAAEEAGVLVLRVAQGKFFSGLTICPQRSDLELGSACRTWSYPRAECGGRKQWNGYEAAGVRAAGGVQGRDRGQHLRGPRRRWGSGAYLVADAIQGVASIWVRKSGDAPSRNHERPSSVSASCVWVRGLPWNVPALTARQLWQAQFHWGKAPPAAEPRIFTCIFGSLTREWMRKVI